VVVIKTFSGLFSNFVNNKTGYPQTKYIQGPQVSRDANDTLWFSDRFLSFSGAMQARR